MPVIVVPYSESWREAFGRVGGALRDALGREALRIDHIGSTAVPGRAAKPIIDIQVTVERLETIDAYEDTLRSLGLLRRDRIRHDRPPPWESDSDPSHWRKVYFSDKSSEPRIHVHVRETGRRNQRYPLLFRDFLREEPGSREAYGTFKTHIAETLGHRSSDGGTGPYLDAKDPVFDLIARAAERWAAEIGWEPGPSDA